MRAMPDVLVEPRIPFAKMPIVDEAREAVARSWLSLCRSR